MFRSEDILEDFPNNEEERSDKWKMYRTSYRVYFLFFVLLIISNQEIIRYSF